jgi:peptide/nickel transport system substrate-binding protein
MSNSPKTWLPAYSGITRRRFLKSAAAGTGAALLIACGGGGNDSAFEDTSDPNEPGSVWFAKNNWQLPDETKQAVRGGIYRGFETDDQEGHFDMIQLIPGQYQTSEHCDEMLMAPNRGPGIEPGSKEYNTTRGALAESWEISPDGMTITFTLRPGVKWHNLPPVNGRVMDIDDWKTSQERYFVMGLYNHVPLLLDHTEYPDARHMVWKTKNPYGPIFERIYSTHFTYAIRPKELNANVTLAEQSAIGTGYKILDKYQPGIGFEYRKHPEYWGGDPFIERWHQPIIPEYSNRYAQFVNRNIQDFSPTARDVLLMHRDAPGAVIVGDPIPDNSATRMRFGKISPEVQAWADPRVRVAIRRSIDFASIGAFLSNKEEFERNGIPVEMTPMTHLPQNPGYWLNPDKNELGALSDNYKYNPAEAKKLMAAAGHTSAIPVPYYVALEDGEIPESNLLVMDSMEASGTVKLEVVRVPTGSEHNRYRIQGLYDGMIPQSGANEDADYFIMRDYHSSGAPAPSRQAFPDPRIDALGDRQRQAIDPEQRIQALKDFQMFMAEFMAAVPGRHLYTQFRFRWPWLHNLAYGAPTGSPSTGQGILGGHLQWLDKDMPNRDTGAS